MKVRKTHRALSFLMTVLMITGLFGNSAIKVFAADPVNLVTNGDFESGNTNGWSTFGGTIAATTEDKASGSYSMKVTNRTASYNGPALDLSTVLKAGTKYNFSLKLKVVPGQTAPADGYKLNVQVKRTSDGKDNYDNVSYGAVVTDSTWTTVTGSYTPSAFSAATLFIATASDLFSFYVDDVVITADAATPAPAATNLLTNGGFEDGQGSWYPFGAATLTATTEDHAEGSKSLKVIGRTANWQGPAIDLSSIIKAGTKYNFSLKLKIVPGQTPVDAAVGYKLNVQVKRTDAGKDNYDNVAYGATVSDSTWTTVTGSYTPGTFSSAVLYIGTATNAENYSFYVDDVVITAEATTPTTPPVTSKIGTKAPAPGTNLVTESTFEDGQTTGWAGRAGTEQLSVVADPANPVNHALQVTGRTTSWHGPAYELIEKVKPGSYYNVSLKVKAAPGQSGAKTVDVSYQTTVNGSQTWPGISGTVAISDTQWTTITGEMSLADATSAMTQLSIYVQSSNATLSYLIDDVSVVEDASKLPQPVQTELTPLKDAFKDYFTVGGEVEPAQIAAGSETEQLVNMHYGILVPGNEMKPSSLEGTKGTFTFGPAEQVVDYAIAHNLPMRGHTLVWHSQVPDWMFRHPDTPTDTTTWATHDELIANETQYITDVLTHFIQKYGTADGNTANGLNPTGKVSPIKYFDTVNEVVSDSPDLSAIANNGLSAAALDKCMRLDPKAPWYEIGGLDYIRTAFNVAHKLDPSLKLFINDYSTENNGSKTQAEYYLIKELLAEGIPVDGVGMQSHMNVGTDMNAVKASIEKFASLGLPIQITELDIKTNENPVTQTGWAKQALAYKQFFDVLKAEKSHINAVLFWGTTDGDSWLKPDQPLLFSAQYQAKPAYYAIVDPAHATVIRQSVQSAKYTPADVNDVAWDTVKPFQVNTFAKGLNGATATVRTMWDSQNLYVKVAVTDATVGANDSVDLFVDKADAKAASYQPDDNYKHITINRSEGVSTSSGYTVYKVIPIADIAPAQNKVLGFDVRVNDDQGSGTVATQAVFNDYGNRQDTNAAYFGDLKLGPVSKIARTVYGTPTIDGVADSMWNSAEEVSTDIFVTGTSGATAKVKTMWDENNLYVLAQVTDPVLNKASANAWEQDSVEIFVDQNNAKTTSYQSDDSQIRVNYDDLVTSGGNMPAGFKSATTKTATGYIVEEAIPFNKVTPAVGKFIGFDAQVNNADATGARVSAATWSDASGNGYQNTSGFGNLLLDELSSVNASAASTTISRTKTTQMSVSAKLASGASVDLSKATVTYASSDDRYAKVDNNGLVTAVMPGSADITATVTLGGNVVQSNTVTINVTELNMDKVDLVIDSASIVNGKILMDVNTDTTVKVKANSAKDLYGFDFYFTYDPKAYTLNASDINIDKDFAADSSKVILYKSVDSVKGEARITVSLLAPAVGVTGDKNLVDIKLTAKSSHAAASFTVKSGAELRDSATAVYYTTSDVTLGAAIADADLARDGKFSVGDIVAVAKLFNQQDPNLDSQADINKDGIIDIADIAYVAVKVLAQ